MSGGVQTEVPPAQASAPSDLSAKPGHNQVTLNWNGSAGASGYNVEALKHERRTVRSDRIDGSHKLQR